MTLYLDRAPPSFRSRDFTAGAQRTLGRLRRQFPGAFQAVKPLALGISDEILARTKLTELELVHFMTFYTRSPAYLSAQAKPGARRVDLNGEAVEPVSDENRRYAAERLDEELALRRDDARWLAFKAALVGPAVFEES